jgi:predicted SAM-dependent methyltransferase
MGLSFVEGIGAAKICYEFLKPGGCIRCAVPDGYFQNEWYQNLVQVGGPGPIDHAAASHKIVHNYQTLTDMFTKAGFEVELLEYCDKTGKFHFNEWNPEDGFVYRSYRYDHRNKDDKLGFISLIVDVIKSE